MERRKFIKGLFAIPATIAVLESLTDETVAAAAEASGLRHVHVPGVGQEAATEQPHGRIRQYVSAGGGCSSTAEVREYRSRNGGCSC